MSGLGARSFRCDDTPFDPQSGGDEMDFDEEDSFSYERKRKHHRKPGRRLERHHPRRKIVHDAHVVVPDANHWVRCIRGARLRDRLGLEAGALLDVRGGPDGVHHSMSTPRCPICGHPWDTWMICNYPGCHDGRLPKPRPPEEK